MDSSGADEIIPVNFMVIQILVTVWCFPVAFSINFMELAD